MAASKVKYLSVEVDNVDLDAPTERTLNIDDLPFGETDDSVAISESGGLVNTVTFYRSATQTLANRKALATITYSSGLPTTEVWQYFDDDGTTLKRTITLTHTWSSGALVSTTEAIT